MEIVSRSGDRISTVYYYNEVLDPLVLRTNVCTVASSAATKDARLVGDASYSSGMCSRKTSSNCNARQRCRRRSSACSNPETELMEGRVGGGVQRATAACERTAARCVAAGALHAVVPVVDGPAAAVRRDDGWECGTNRTGGATERF